MKKEYLKISGLILIFNLSIIGVVIILTDFNQLSKYELSFLFVLHLSLTVIGVYLLDKLFFKSSFNIELKNLKSLEKYHKVKHLVWQWMMF